MFVKIVFLRNGANAVFSKSVFLLFFLIMIADKGFSADSVRTLADTIILGVHEFEKRALEEFPLLLEKSTAVEKHELELKALKSQIILPRFEFRSLMGPAPGLRTNLDTTTGTIPSTGESVIFTSPSRDFDFGSLTGWGPFFGIEVSAAQPLNYGRYLKGRKAKRLQLAVTQAEFEKEVVEVSRQSQELYFSYLYARRILQMLEEAQKELDRAEERIEEMLDDEQEGVSQEDLLNLRSRSYDLLKNKHSAWAGLNKAIQNVGFMLDLPQGTKFKPKDDAPGKRPEKLPSLDSLKRLLLQYHPDLKRLENGIKARQELVELAKGELGPDIFIFGQVKYAKAWSSSRESGSDDPFARDPLNEITGVAGLGMSMKLNFWNKYQDFRKKKLDLVELKRTEAYAAAGLLMRLEESWFEFQEATKNISASKKSMRAAEALLKSSSMKYDLDPTAADELMESYPKALVARNNYFEAVLEYNLKFAEILAKTGLTLSGFQKIGNEEEP